MQDVGRRPVVLVSKPEIQAQVWFHPPRIVDEVRLLKRIGVIHGAAEGNRGEGSLRARERVDKIPERREPAACRKRQRALSVERNELLRYLAHQVRSCPDCVGASRVGDRVLELIVVEDPALREERGGQPSQDADSTDRRAGKQKLRAEGERSRVLSSEQNVEPSI